MAVFVAAVAAAACALRAVGYADVFTSDGEVLLNFADASYHARRALFSYANFPAVLRFDRYLAYPAGAVVPMPPGFDWALAAVARITGDFERTAAWVSPILGAAAVAPVYLMTRIFAGRGTAIFAAALYAVLPIAALFCELGNPDHHAAVALLVSLYGLVGCRTLAPSLSRARGAALATALGAVRTAMALCWSGSLLYLGIGEAALLLAGVVTGRREVFARQALGAALAALALAPFAAFELSAPFTATSLSWLHVSCLLAASIVGLAIAVLERQSPAANAFSRLVRLAGLAALCAVGALAIPELRAALEPALSFLGKTDASSPTISEQRPLFAWLSAGVVIPGRSAGELYGLLAMAIPLAPLGFLLAARAEAKRAAAVNLAVWSGALGILAVSQVRFGNEFASLFCVGVASLGAQLVASFPMRARVRWVVGGLLALLGASLVAPGVASYYGPKLARARSLSADDADGAALYSPSGTLVRFARSVRAATPETSGYLNEAAAPEYAILSPSGFGHVLHYAARRATPSDNFGVWLDAEKFRATARFFAATTEAESAAIAERLGSRFVMTADHPGLRAPRIDYRLQREHGSAVGRARHLERFRLITEGPKGGRPLAALRGTSAVVPYKLFELVEGAVLDVEGAPRTVATAEIVLVSPIGERFRFAARGVLDDDGRLALRVPYATDGRTPTRAVGPWIVRVGQRELRFSVAERDVLEGRHVRAAS